MRTMCLGSTTVETVYVISFCRRFSGDDVCTTDFEKARELGKFLAHPHASVAEYPDGNDFPVQNVYNEVISWAWPMVRQVPDLTRPAVS